MRIALFAAMFVLSGCRCETTPLAGFCPVGHPCYDDGEGVDVDPSRVVRAPCRLGIVIGCKDDEPVCDGQVSATRETCNGVDDDCDGEVDNLPPLYPDDPENTCAVIGICQMATMYCVGGRYDCEYTVPPSPEVCNGLDDDCNGVADDGIAAVPFYPEDQYPNTVGVGACTYGVDRCTNGHPSHTPATTPTTEIVGDCIDNDCDGYVDEDPNRKARAFVLVIDKSGSMYNAQPLRNEAIRNWLNAANGPGDVYALVDVAAGTAPAFVYLRQDFADAAATAYDLDAQTPIMSESSDEYMLEGTMLGARLNWPPDSERHVLEFTDETLQVLDVQTTDVAADCVLQGYDIGVFTFTAIAGGWSWAVDDCNGYVNAYVSSPALLGDELIRRYPPVSNCP